ncbi:hypothetical protein NQ318_020893 [Aromia moschata]|uniref:HTH psq-type domain-containing protein n=1 Tax=Aromia moschata TaxID=1265417 RepID=A0AAV8XYA0_9CUCU|nr:hypothetical protein NQ318_020893 [Aromia moschata]
MDTLSKKRKQWSATDMTNAIESVRNRSMGYLAAAKAFKVPRTTLFRLCNTEGPPATVSKTQLGKKPVLSPELEEELVRYLLLMDKKFFGLTRRDVRSMAFHITYHIHSPFCANLQEKIATLSLRNPTGTSLARAVGFNRENVDEFFNLLEEVMTKQNYGPHQIYTCGT